MPIERAVYRVTGEIGDWFNLPLGKLIPGSRADVAIIEPSGLDDSLDTVTEEEMPGFDGLHRLVRRSDSAVPVVIINGRVAMRHGVREADFGKSTSFGRVIRAQDT